MTKFFFNFRQGNSYSVERQDPFLCSFEVTDEAGDNLFILPFGEVLDVCRGRSF